MNFIKSVNNNLFDKFITILLVVIIILLIYNYYRKEISPLYYAIISIILFLILDKLVSYNIVNKLFNNSKSNKDNDSKEWNQIDNVKIHMSSKKKMEQSTKKDEIGDDESNGPLDGLSPNELSKRLKYLYYATSHPKEKVSYIDYQTYHDKIMNHDNSSLASKDKNILERTSSQYPDLTSLQINARDCMNESGDKSCYQTLDIPVNNCDLNLDTSSNGNNILKDGLNKDNINQVIREDFTCPGLVNDTNPLKPLFINSPGNPNEKQFDISNLLCRGCTVDSCNSCNEHNELFI